MKLSRQIITLINQSLLEDSAYNDITTRILIDPKSRGQAHIVVKEKSVICGVALAKQIFKEIDSQIQFIPLCNDGDQVQANTKVAFIKGKTQILLTAERVALNFLGQLSGIATLTNQFVQTIKPFKAEILDTRKTTPGLRELEKYAVRCGGGKNHRSDLSEMVLVKDNHLAALKTLTIPQVIQKLRSKTQKKIEIEVDNLVQFKAALCAKPDMILLDNMNVRQMTEAVQMLRASKGNKPLLEASGGINLKNVRSIAATGVDRISIGSLTHSARAINFSMDMMS